MKKLYPNSIQSLGAVGIMVFLTIAFSPITFILNPIVGSEASMLIYYVFSVGLSFFIINYIKKKITGESSFNLTSPNLLIIPLIIIGSSALMYGIVTPISSLIPMPDSLKELFASIGNETGIFSFVLMVIAAPILEELIFRGIVLDGLLKNYSPIKAILLSSVLFGLAHLNPWQFITGLFFGIFTGWVYYRTRSLVYAILIHATANLNGFLVRCYADFESAMTETIVESYGGIINLILAIIGSIIAVGFSVYFINKQKY